MLKSDPHFSYILALVFFWFSVGCFFAVFRLFSGDLGFQYSHPHPDSSSFLKFLFRVLAIGPCGSLCAKYSTLGQNSSRVTYYSYVKYERSKGGHYDIFECSQRRFYFSWKM